MNLHDPRICQRAKYTHAHTHTHTIKTEQEKKKSQFQNSLIHFKNEDRQCTSFNSLFFKILINLFQCV